MAQKCISLLIIILFSFFFFLAGKSNSMQYRFSGALFVRPCQLRVRVANESETVGHWAFRFLFIVVGCCKLLSSPMLLLLLLRLILLLLLRLMLLLRSLKCSTKLVHPAIAQATLSFLLLHVNDNLVFMAFYDGSIDPAEKYIQKKNKNQRKNAKLVRARENFWNWFSAWQMPERHVAKSAMKALVVA